MPIAGLLGRKLGMTQVFDDSGALHAVTVIEITPQTVTQVKTAARDGYDALQLGYGDDRNNNKPMRGHLGKLGGFRLLREFRLEGQGEHALGDAISIDLFNEGDFVDIRGTSKGRGFAGGVKRHGFHGGPKTHGQSDRHRAPGSIGSGTTPGRVYKGQKMAGHMGAANVTSKNLRVVRKDEAKGLLLVAGAVPGASNTVVRVTHAKSHRKK
jgi:large subunit ribosomal protein L3